MIGKNTLIYHPDKTVIGDKVHVGSDCKIHAFCWINGVIGDRCSIQANVFIPEGVTLGNDVFVGPGTVFTNDKRPPSRGAMWAKIIVGDKVSFGANCTICPGVKIGDGAFIGAGSVVTKDIPPNSIAYGNPARIH